MKKLFINLLLLANLFSGMAFAWDNDPVAMLGHELTVDQVKSISVLQPHDVLSSQVFSYDELSHDDHCSHGAAHVVGIFYHSSVKKVAIEGIYHFVPGVSLAFLYISPLLRPPIV
jgi:hypothetical protein